MNFSNTMQNQVKQSLEPDSAEVTTSAVGSGESFKKRRNRKTCEGDILPPSTWASSSACMSLGK